MDHTKLNIFPHVNKNVAPGDGMLGEDESHYFAVGASAISCIRSAFLTAQKQRQSVKSVLDYACGYGRVLRWLKAEFPEARLLGVDADPKAASAA